MTEDMGFADLAEGTLLSAWPHVFSREEIETYCSATETPCEMSGKGVVCPFGLLGHYTAVRGQIPARLPDGSLHITQRIQVFQLPVEGDELIFQTRVSRKFHHRGHPHFEFSTSIRNSDQADIGLAVSTYRWAF